MSLFLRDYLTIVWFGLAAVLLAGLLLGVAAAVRPSRPSKAKLTNYESGVDPVGAGWSQSQVRYYVFALLFVIFDVEAVFIFPWAAAMERYGWFGLVAMGIFIVFVVPSLTCAESIPSGATATVSMSAHVERQVARMGILAVRHELFSTGRQRVAAGHIPPDRE